MAYAASVAKLKEKGITPDRIDEYKAAFDLFDVDRTGIITVATLGKLLNEKFDQSFGADDLKYMLQQFGDGDSIDFVAFATSLHEKMADPRYNEAFGDAFDLFSGGMPELTSDALRSNMLKLGETLTPAEADEMIKVAKKKDDFVRTMTNAVSATAAPAPAAAGGGGAAAGAAAPAAAAAAPAGAAASPAGPAAGGARPAGPGAPGARPAGPGGPGGPGPGTPGARPAGPGAPGAGPATPGARPAAPRPPGAPGGATPGAPRPPRAPGAPG